MNSYAIIKSSCNQEVVSTFKNISVRLKIISISPHFPYL